MVKKFRKKPVVIEAMQFNAAGAVSDAVGIIGWILDNGGTATLYCNNETECKAGIHTIAIQTLEGVMHASRGDWIIRGVEGEFYPCKPDIFEKSYEEAND